MSDGHDPSADRPTSGNSRFPDPFAPEPPSPGDSPPGATAAGPTDAPVAGQAPPPASPGDQDLPWKATAERRDLWGPRETPLEGAVHRPAGLDVTRSGTSGRGLAVLLGVPLLLGGLAGAATLLLVLGTGLAGPLLALMAAAGVGVVAAGGSGAALRVLRRAPAQAPVLAGEVTGSTRETLERILRADEVTRQRVAELRPRASNASATRVLDEATALVTRIDALVGSEQLQSMRSSSGEIMMLEGMASRYLPELLDAAEDILGFLQTFAGTAREEALENLDRVIEQIAVLAEGVEQIETDIVGGVSRSLDVHSEFLRARFADHHVDPMIDV
ncbi:hypothetical protein [Brachybacterium sp. YJGR34]|uniref:hypothetical protein n=1 Tax=Brachybacterium sp. YJGR34 TaxID=2059911 RepID=UPI000E0ADE89|nr:hypothetical protein [Brachybacterium sp. YJGR34]